MEPEAPSDNSIIHPVTKSKDNDAVNNKNKKDVAQENTFNKQRSSDDDQEIEA